jgi:hypothetical protein
MLLTWSHQMAGFSGPANEFAPVVSGSGLVGGELTCDPGTWSGTPPPIFTYQWKRNGVDIPGETNSTYTSVEADLGQFITCTVTATNIKGSTQADSNVVQIGGAPENTVLPHVTAPTVQIGDTATTTNGTWVAYPAPTFSYTWLRQGLPIPGAPDQNTYVFQAGDEGSSIQCRVTATNFFGANPATSNAVGPITQPLSAPVNTSPPIASGNAVVTQSTDCGNGLWSGNPTPTYTYQWQRDQVDIPSATNDTYDVVEADLGAMLRVVVTATNSQGFASAPSNELGPVVSPP